MNEIVKVTNTGFKRYEELLLRKNDLKKECFLLEQEYIRVFGQEILAVFQAKVECAKKVKTIEFCQKAINRGSEPDTTELQEFVARETKELEEHFGQMTEEYERSKNTGKVTEAELMEIRKTYRKLAKQLHPDIHPEVAESRKLKDLWNQVSAAYACNELKALKELDVLVTAAVAEAGGLEANIEIPEIDEKIAALEKEIEEIMTTDPWQYKFLLDDPAAVEEKKQAYLEELKTYQEHSKQLDRMLEDILPEGTMIIWT